MRKYTLVIQEENGLTNFESINDGFNAFELSGFLYKKLTDIQQQIDGTITPDTIQRVAVVDVEQEKKGSEIPENKLDTEIPIYCPMCGEKCSGTCAFLPPQKFVIFTDPLKENLEVLSDLVEAWKRNESLGKPARAIQSAILMQIEEIKTIHSVNKEKEKQAHSILARQGLI